MFSIDDDFDVDEDFLENVFDGESYTRKEYPGSNKPPVCSTSKPLQDINNINNNSSKSQAKSNNVSDFLELWNSNEDKLFFSESPNKTSNRKLLLDTVRAVSPIGVRSEVFTRNSKHVRQRKFPGPAGLLPERTSNTSFIEAEEFISSTETEDDSNSNFENKEILSQASNKFFEDPGSAWRTMVEDLGPRGIELITSINLGSVRVKQAKFGFKVPFLAVCVYNIDCSLPDPSLILKDKIDEIHATFHRDVWEDWKDEIVVGSVIVLRNTGVISAGSSSRRFFLNVTAKNIVTIYSPKQDTGIKVTQIQSKSGLDTSQILLEWERVMTQTRQQQLGSDTPPPQPLYNTFSNGGSPLHPSGFQGMMPSSPSIGHPFTPPSRPNFRPRTPLYQQRPSPNFQLHSTPLQRPRHSPPLGQQIRRLPNPQLNSSFGQGNTRPQMPSPCNPRHMVTSRPQGISQQQSLHRHTANPVICHQGISHPSIRAPAFSSSNISRGMTNDVPKQSSNVPYSNFGSVTYSPGIVTCSPHNTNIEGSGGPIKKPKISNDTGNQIKPSSSSVFSVLSPTNESIVDSVLDGVDTDLLFDDF